MTTARRLAVVLAGTVGGSALAVGVAAAAAPASPSAWPTSPSVTGAYGLDFSADHLYVARRGTGIDSVAADGTVTHVTGGGAYVMAVSVGPDGDIYYTEDSSNLVRRIDAVDLAANPAAYQAAGWEARTTTVATGPGSFLYGMDVADDGTIYVSDVQTRGLYALHGGTTTRLTTDTKWYGIDLAPSGDLYVADVSGYELRRVDAAALRAGTPLAPEDVTDVAPIANRLYGLAFFGDGSTFYQADAGRVTKATLPGGPSTEPTRPY